MTRRATVGRDAEQTRALGLDYAAGDRVVTIPRYPVGDWSTGQYRTVPMVYWSVVWTRPDGTRMDSGVAKTERLARVAIAERIAR